MIGDVEPMGLCGSGLVDAVAELVRVGLIDGSGRFVTGRGRPVGGAGPRRPAHQDRRRAVFVLHRPHPDADPADCVVL